MADIREAAAFASAVESLSRTAKNAIEIERNATTMFLAAATASAIATIGHGH